MPQNDSVRRPLISIASDFAVQSQGIAIMKGVIYEICPSARVIDLMHGLPSFNLTAGARAMETAHAMPRGFHICVVDPVTSANRRCIAIETKRGDFLIGPDNGVLVPATRFLGGIKSAVEISNKKTMRNPVSPTFHGRDVFAPAAAHLANGVLLKELGRKLQAGDLAHAPYEEAALEKEVIRAKVIHVNKFGSIHLNLTHEAADEFKLKNGDEYEVYFGSSLTRVPYKTTFADVRKGEAVLFKDDFGRMEIAINMGSLSEKYGLSPGSHVKIIL